MMWTAEREIELFDALTLYKPMGFQKHFMMVLVLERLNTSKYDFPCKEVWKHIEEMYDLETLDESQDDPVSSEFAGFCLPSSYNHALADRCGVEMRTQSSVNVGKSVEKPAHATRSTDVITRNQRKRTQTPAVDDEPRGNRRRTTTTPDSVPETRKRGRRAGRS
eukprot:CFRG3094T1